VPSTRRADADFDLPAFAPSAQFFRQIEEEDMHQIDMLTEIQIRQQNAAREARVERNRLVRAALGERRAHFYQPALVSLGKQLVVWGMQLQRRNSAPYRGRDVMLAPFNK
jgi:hypothetical protein